MVRELLPSEDQEQQTVCQYLHIRKVGFFHVPNGGSRHLYEAVKLKSLGVRPGVPDLCIVDKPPNFPEARGVWIEMKRKKGGVVSDHQKWWIQYLQDQGHLVQVCHGAEEAIQYLRKLGW